MRLPCSLRLLAMTVRVSTKIAHNTNNLLDTVDKPRYDNE
ncbi:RPE4 domain protein [Rickettsia parkeri str. Tate's Hell]|nr:RPE4 domain protein [Rickettsia parkeri str. AT\